MIKVNRFLNWLLPYWFKETFIYKPHRAIHGWAPNDTWGLDEYLTNVIIDSVKHLRDNTHSYPIQCGIDGCKNWYDTLTSIIEAFEDYKNYDSNYQKRHRELQKKYGVKTWGDEIKEFDEFISYLNDDSNPKIPDDALAAFFAEEKIIYDDIKKRMSKIIEVWGDLWD